MAAIVDPGEAIVHHSMIIHRADANPSDRNRVALGLVYHAERAVQDVDRRDAYRKELAARWKAEGKL